jgi:hypothetical protein
MRTFVIAAVALLTACEGGKTGGFCAAPVAGTYRQHFDEQSGGTCGPLPDAVVIVDPSTPDTGCTVTTASTDPDGCGVSFAETCSDGNMITTKIYLHLDGTPDYSLVTVANADCASTYRVTFAAL